MGMIGSFVWIIWRLLSWGMSEFDCGVLLLPEFEDLPKVVRRPKEELVCFL